MFRLPPTEQVPPKTIVGQAFPPSRMYRQGVQILQASRPSSDQPCQTVGLSFRNSMILSFLVDGAKAAVGVDQVWNQPPKSLCFVLSSVLDFGPDRGSLPVQSRIPASRPGSGGCRPHNCFVGNTIREINLPRPAPCLGSCILPK